MAQTRQCKLCGIKTQKLAQHIADKHSEYLADSDGLTERMRETFGICHWTAYKARQLAGFRKVKYCPRCGKEREGMVGHLLECHMPLLMCARYSLKLEHKDVVRMFFNNGFSGNTISLAFQTLAHDNNIETIDRDELPRCAIPICIEDGKVRPMEIGEIGRGLIFADPGVSW